MMTLGQNMGTDAPYEPMDSVLWERKEDSSLFEVAAVLDPLAWPGLREKLEECGEESLVLFSGALDQEHAGVMPHCALVSPSSPLDVYLSRHVHEHGALFIRWEKEKGKELADVAARLSRANRAWLPEGRGVWFRWYDPIILSDFWPLASPEQRAFLLGEWIESVRTFHPLRKQWEIFPAARAQPLSSRLDISAEQMERMGENSFERFIHRVVMTLHVEHAWLPPAMLEPRARQSVELAEENGIFGANELARFACLDARTGWLLWDDAEALALLHASGKTDMEKLQALETYIAHQNKRESL